MGMTIRVYRRDESGEEQEIVPEQKIRGVKLSSYAPLQMPQCSCPMCRAKRKGEAQ